MNLVQPTWYPRRLGAAISVLMEMPWQWGGVLGLCFGVWGFPSCFLEWPYCNTTVGIHIVDDSVLNSISLSNTRLSVNRVPHAELLTELTFNKISQNAKSAEQCT